MPRVDRREDAERVEIEERAFGDSGRQPPLVEERRTESHFDNLVAVPLRIVVVLVRVVLIDRVAILRGARQFHLAAEKARQNGVDIRPRHSITDVPSASSIRTGGSSSPARGGSTKAARHANRLGHSFGCFALATLPVSLSRKRVRAVADDPALT